MISQRPSGSMIGVTHSDSEGWQACDRDVLALWPDATGYSLILAFEGWPNWNGPNVALLWEVFGQDCPGPRDADSVLLWVRRDGAFRRAQHVFLLPDVLDCQPLLIYRCLGAPDPALVNTAVRRAQAIAAGKRRREDAPFDLEGSE